MVSQLKSATQIFYAVDDDEADMLPVLRMQYNPHEHRFGACFSVYVWLAR